MIPAYVLCEWCRRWVVSCTHRCKKRPAMMRYRVEYLYIPKSSRLAFTVLVPGPESVGQYQAARVADEWLIPACPPLYRWDLAMLSAVYQREEPGHVSD